MKFNGAQIGDADRRRYEAEFLRRSQERDKRLSVASPQLAPPKPGEVGAPSDPSDGSASLDGLLRQAREPQFVSSAYFLRFKFEEGKYALVGREMLDGHEVMRVEYYPANLYSAGQGRRMARTITRRIHATPKSSG